MLRVFSYNQERWMPQKALEEYNNLCKMADQQGEEEGTGEEVNISKLPKVEEMFTMTNVKNGEINKDRYNTLRRFGFKFEHDEQRMQEKQEKAIASFFQEINRGN